MLKRIWLLLVMLVFFTDHASYAQHSRLRLMTYNVRNAKGMDNKTDYDRIVVVLKKADADIIALQELDSATTRSGGENVVKTLAEKSGSAHVYGAAISYQGGKYGVGILSKKKPSSYYKVALAGKEEERVLLVAEFKKYVIFCTHLSLTDSDRLASVNIINDYAAKYKKPVYLLGDLNAEPNSNVIVALKANWKLLSGEEPTFPAPVPTKCIDYILVMNGTRLKVISKDVLNEPMASDHSPVVVEVTGK